MKYYDQKNQMRNYVSSVLTTAQAEKKRISFIRLCIEVYSKFPLVGKLAVKNYLLDLQEIQQNLKFDGKEIYYD